MTFQITDIKKMSQNHGQQGWFHDFQEDHLFVVHFCPSKWNHKKIAIDGCKEN